MQSMPRPMCGVQPSYRSTDSSDSLRSGQMDLVSPCSSIECRIEADALDCHKKSLGKLCNNLVLDGHLYTVSDQTRYVRRYLRVISIPVPKMADCDDGNTIQDRIIHIIESGDTTFSPLLFPCLQ